MTEYNDAHNRLAPERRQSEGDRRACARPAQDVEEALDRKLRDHELREEDRIRALIKAHEAEAFPDGPTAHRLAHQAMIDAAKQEAEFWRGLKVEIAKKSIWGILQILSILVLGGLAAKFGFGALMAGAIK